ncbi:hypothetical protein ACFQZZ_26080 [Nocardia sp. GCM10030253]|uniref:hypothetical protein n=1 Tax=Nocardia sp. GCM10030253 TaxID=3273404 RepID=UPI00363FC3F4
MLPIILAVALGAPMAAIGLLLVWVAAAIIADVKTHARPAGQSYLSDLATRLGHGT